MQTAQDCHLDPRPLSLQPRELRDNRMNGPDIQPLTMLSFPLTSWPPSTFPDCDLKPPVTPPALRP